MSNLKTEHEIEIDQIHDRQLAEKDAEIQRLKADLEYWHHIATVDQRQLITELADALDRCDPIHISIGEVADLIDQARTIQ